MAFNVERTNDLIHRVGSGDFLFQGQFTTDGNETWRNVRYVNAYEKTQAYGGAEEGGWWYFVGEPIASVPVRHETEAIDAIVALRKQFGDDYAEERECTSAAGGVDLEIVVDYDFAQPYPPERPHYE